MSIDDEEEALGALRGIVVDLALLSDKLHNRMHSDDIPYGAGVDVAEEFCRELDDLSKTVDEAETILTLGYVNKVAGVCDMSQSAEAR